MDSESELRYHHNSYETLTLETTSRQVAAVNDNAPQSNGNGSSNGGKHLDAPLQVIDSLNSDEILCHIQAGHLLVVNKRQRNGLVLYKPFHAEFAGPGAAVGGLFDQECQKVIPIGDLSLLSPETHEERQEAYLIRRQWIRLTQQFTDTSESVQRAQKILNQFETYFDPNTIAHIPDESFALLVGVLPHTVRMARRPVSKVKMQRLKAV